MASTVDKRYVDALLVFFLLSMATLIHRNCSYIKSALVIESSIKNQYKLLSQHRLLVLYKHGNEQQ